MNRNDRLKIFAQLQQILDYRFAAQAAISEPIGFDQETEHKAELEPTVQAEPETLHQVPDPVAVPEPYLIEYASKIFLNENVMELYLQTSNLLINPRTRPLAVLQAKILFNTVEDIATDVDALMGLVLPHEAFHVERVPESIMVPDAYRWSAQIMSEGHLVGNYYLAEDPILAGLRAILMHRRDTLALCKLLRLTPHSLANPLPYGTPPNFIRQEPRQLSGPEHPQDPPF